MIHGFNPMFASHGWREDLVATPFIVCFSSFMDETSEMADLILPDHTYLERWDIHYSYGPTGLKALSLTQPALRVQHNTRQTADVLLAVARELGGDVAAALTFDSAKEIVEKSVTGLPPGDSSENSNAEQSWTELTEKGVVSAGSPATAKSQTAEQAPISLNKFYLALIQLSASRGSENTEYPMNLIVYEHAALGDGSVANLPSVQELPDPMTSVMWGSWVEINPQTAAAMGIADGDLVEVTTSHGSVRAPALLYPAIRPDCIAMPTGQGHSSYGRYARGRGVHPGALHLPSENTVRSRLTKIGGKAQLIRFGTDLMEHMESKR